MAITVNDLITDALTDLGVLQAGEVPTFSDSDLGFRRLNGLVDGWITQRLMIYTTDSGDGTFTGAATFTVGFGGDCNILRPTLYNLITVVWYDANAVPQVEYPLTPFTDDGWFNLPNKDMNAPQPTNYWWRADFPLANITLWPGPTANANRFFRIYYPQQIVEFTALTQTVVLPPGYRRFIVSNLALELAPAFGVDPPPSLIQRARDSRDDVMRANQTISDLYFPNEALIGNRGSWSIYTGP